MTADHPPTRGPDPDLSRVNDHRAIEDLLAAVRDAPDEYCLKAAHPFGTVYVRYDATRDHWYHTALRQTLAGPPSWRREQRIDARRRYALFAYADVDVRGRSDYPRVAAAPH